MSDLISIITCVRNSEKYLQECLESIEAQNYDHGQLELSIYDDGSSDRSLDIINSWYNRYRLSNNDGIRLIINSNPEKDQPKGVGGAKNRAIAQSNGNYLCFFDSDDIMHADRIMKRIPENSTQRYMEWVNNLTADQLTKQVYTCFGPTILMPTWFCTRKCFDKIGAFDDSDPKGVPEDLIFFYKHIYHGGGILRADDVLLTYRYHQEATTFSVTDEAIWNIRLAELEKNVLNKWDRFMIWNAGKEGRRFYRCLSEENRNKVEAFCDVDPKKLAKKFYIYENCIKGIKEKPKIPIIHFSNLKPPVVICVKLGLTNGQFEQNLRSMNLHEAIDFVHFG
ncbi:UDP-GlcNAc:betaGal beta-1,3-N-acetylglucosaminyltransferase-like protein 1 [Dermatophagoides farinae]|uniref:Udp-glcnac:betagal beta-1 n=1 Tax=Dermatophagoides farinae TaxID=6954 RepID=A0A922HY17_DERFA|nr:udp-glcnac:betagal beta-1 [Dermatophagoides farinae]KAH9510987.1 UDP-GlcNAc:betaGal beta-1,3-N-acetylglucosaminyltransferase-like protein 1 [Dermatophagoides farinae]